MTSSEFKAFLEERKLIEGIRKQLRRISSMGYVSYGRAQNGSGLYEYTYNNLISLVKPIQWYFTFSEVYNFVLVVASIILLPITIVNLMFSLVNYVITVIYDTVTLGYTNGRLSFSNVVNFIANNDSDVIDNDSVGVRDCKLGDPSSKLHPWYVTGLTDGEGCFSVTQSVRGINKLKTTFEFKVTQQAKNAGVLYDLQRFFGVGSVVIDNRSDGDGTLKYHLTSQQSLIDVVLPHFDNFPLQTSKKLNFASFKETLLINKSLIEFEGSKDDNITSIKNGKNKGRSFADKFGSVSLSTLDPEWVRGFVDGEGTFYAYVALKTSRGSTYRGVDLSIEVGQSSHDVALLHSLVSFFGGGYVSPSCDYTSLDAVEAILAKSIFKLKDISTVIYFFDKYPLLTNKQLTIFPRLQRNLDYQIERRS